MNVSDLAMTDLLQQVRSEAEKIGAPKHRWKIFETSGTRPGQGTAFGLMGFGAVVAIVGFTNERLEVRLSNLWIGACRIRISPFVERHPLAVINRVFEAAHRGELLERTVLVP